MSKTSPESMIQKHYFLIAGNVVYKVDSGNQDQNPMGIITLNGVITSGNQTLGVADLNQAQQVLQHHFRAKTEDNTLEVVDVVILNIAYLGFQSENEFNNLNLTPVQ